MIRRSCLFFSPFFLLLAFFLFLPSLHKKALAVTVQIPKHGAFSVHYPSDVDQAAALGIQYIMPYYWGTFGRGVNPTDPTSDIGSELTKKNVKVIVDVTDYNKLYSCQGGKVVADINFLTSIVNQVKNSPLTMGYWTKDDDLTGCGSMASAMQQVYTAIRKGLNGAAPLDPDPTHYIIPGFGGVYSLKANYAPGEGDIIAYYPYRAYNNLDPYCKSAGDQKAQFDCEVKGISVVKEPWIGVYQAFCGHNNVGNYNIPCEATADVTYDVQQYISAGAISLMAFGWRANDVDTLAYNNQNIRTQIGQVNGIAQSITSTGSSGNGGNYTATSSCVVTKIGNPANPPVIPPGCVCSAPSSTNNGKNIIWLDSASSGEFSPHMDWIGSQCSQASLAEILNAYGGRSATISYPGKKSSSGLYTIEEVIAVGQSLGVWNNQFLGPFQQNWQKEGDYFGFNVQWNQIPNPGPADLDKIINMANQGTPLIVGAPNHYLVVWGGDSQYVWTLDSSGNNLTWAPASTSDSVNISRNQYSGNLGSNPLTRAKFLCGAAGFCPYWDGTYILLTPKNGFTPGGTTSSGTTASSNVCQGPAAGSNNALIQAGEALKTAYDACLGGFTYAGQDSCIASSLKSSGYTDTAISAFTQRRPVTLNGSNCTQCLGFVAEALALAEATTNMPIWSQAKDVLSVSSFQVGSSTYVKVPNPQPGDIGVANANVNNGGDIIGSAGHILIVYKLNGNVKFTAIESNWGTPGCRVSDTVDYHLVEDFTYYRKQ